MLINLRINILKWRKHDILDFLFELLIGHSGLIKGMGLLFEHVHYDSTWPYIDSLSVCVIPENLWRHKEVGAALAGGRWGPELEFCPQSKVGYLEFVQFVSVLDKDVFGFDVAVDNT